MSSAHPDLPTVALTPQQYRAAIVAALLTVTLGALDQTIVGVAVPSIARQLGGAGWMAWLISGYLIASTVATPLYGKLADSHGRRPVLIASITLFMLASVGCALAQSMPQLVLARVVQGLGGGGLSVLAQSIIADVAPPRERGKLQSYISIVWAVASLIGPVVGGVMTEWLSWPWIFWINLPAGALALWLAHASLRALPLPSVRQPIDWLGATWLLAGITAFLLPITRMGQGTSLFEPVNLGALAAAAVLLLLFWRREGRAASRMLPLALLKEPALRLSCAILFVCFFLFIALSVLIPMRLQLAGGMSTSTSALMLLPLTVAIPVAAFLGGRWIGTHGTVRPLLRLGTAMVPLGLAALALLPPLELLGASLAMVVIGLGMGLQMPSTLLTAQHAVPRPMIGMATALTVFFRLLGGAIGIAVLTALALALIGPHATLAGAEGGPADYGGAPRLVDDAAFRITLLAGAALSVLGWLLSLRLADVRLHDAAQQPVPAMVD